MNPQMATRTQEEWEEQHAVCPQCGSDDSERTTMGEFKGPDHFYDPNKVRCLSCGWSGDCVGLVPRTEDGEIVDELRIDACLAVLRGVPTESLELLLTNEHYREDAASQVMRLSRELGPDAPQYGAMNNGGREE